MIQTASGMAFGGLAQLKVEGTAVSFDDLLIEIEELIVALKRQKRGKRIANRTIGVLSCTLAELRYQRRALGR